MFQFTKASTVRAALAAAAVALFASQAAYAGQQPREISYWAEAHTAAPAGDHGASGQWASRAGGREDGGAAQFANRASDAHGYNTQIASRAGDREYGANADV